VLCGHFPERVYHTFRNFGGQFSPVQKHRFEVTIAQEIRQENCASPYEA
jgi:hypothetical protein